MSKTQTVELETKIVSFANQKGGVGKTTLTHLAAVFLTKALDKKVLVIEGDPQKTLTKLKDSSSEIIEDIQGNPSSKEEQPSKEIEKYSIPYDLKYVDIEKIPKELEKQHGLYDVILIDLPGMLEIKGVRAVYTYCDVVYIPMSPSTPDLSSSFDFIEEIQKIKEGREKLDLEMDFFVVLSRANKSLSRTKAFIEQLKESGLPMIKTPVYDYEIYRERIEDYQYILAKGKKSWGSSEHNFRDFMDEFVQTLN